LGEGSKKKRGGKKCHKFSAEVENWEGFCMLLWGRFYTATCSAGFQADWQSVFTFVRSEI